MLSIEHGWYRVVDESNDDYLYPPENFETVDDSDIDQVSKRYTGEEFYEKYKMHGAERIETEGGSKGYWGEVKKGRSYGRGKVYYPDGTLKMEGIFGIKGLLEGWIYWPDGNIRFEGKFRINRNYGPNIPVDGTLYGENGRDIYRGEIHVRCVGGGYLDDYKMPLYHPWGYNWIEAKKKGDTYSYMQKDDISSTEISSPELVTCNLYVLTTEGETCQKIAKVPLEVSFSGFH